MAPAAARLGTAIRVRTLVDLKGRQVAIAMYGGQRR